MQVLPTFASMAGFDHTEWQNALSVWHARTQKVAAGMALLAAGDPVRNLYVVLEGRVHLTLDDYWGNRSVLSVVEAGHIFGAAYAFADATAYPFSAVATVDSTVLVVPMAAFRASQSSHPALFAKAQQGFLRALANRSIALVNTIQEVKQRTTRQKVLAYLSCQSRLVGSATFDVPLTRQQLADYLAVDRAALCRELSRLAADGLVGYHGRRFTLYLPSES